jgi:hypothetical protein
MLVLETRPRGPAFRADPTKTNSPPRLIVENGVSRSPSTQIKQEFPLQKTPKKNNLGKIYDNLRQAASPA